MQVFQQDDTFSFSFGNKETGPDGQFQYPVGIAIDCRNNDVLVSDNFCNCVHLFSHDGHYISKIDCYRPWAITVSPTGYVITGHDGNNNKLTIWSPTHQLIHQFGRIGSQPGRFSGITGMAVGSSGDICVVEESNKRLQIITNSSS